MKSIVYIGMDVHKATFSLCALDNTTGEILGSTKCVSEAKMVEKFIDSIVDKHGTNFEFRTGYEAGCLGFSLYHELTNLGINCVILAPSTMLKTGKNKRVKNDKRDAKMIASNLANGTYSAVHVPDEIDEITKQYIGMRKDFKRAQQKVKQQLGALLLKHHFHYDKTNWTAGYFSWVKGLKVPNLLRLTIDEYLIEIQEKSAKIERFDTQIEKLSQDERYREPVQALRCLKGLETTAAMTIHAEISDFSRFPSARSFMSYLGLTPSEHSSGDHIVRGSLTKQGNVTVRTMLIECVHGLIKGEVGYKTKSLLRRQKGHSAELIRYVDNATAYLKRRYEHLMYKGKQKNVAVTAVARELAGFIWGIETQHINF